MQYILLLILFFIVSIYLKFYLDNPKEVTVNFFGNQKKVSLGLLILTSFLDALFVIFLIVGIYFNFKG